MDSWRCSTCGQVHERVPTGYGYEAPWTWYTIEKEERAQRSFLDADYCIIDCEDYFVRGCVEIPIIGSPKPFVWGVWVSLSKVNFERERSLSSDPNRINEPPYFGWFSSRIEIYPDTTGLKTRVHTREVGTRPLIELEPTEHPLFQEQRNGITHERVVQIAELIQHGWKHQQSDTNHG